MPPVMSKPSGAAPASLIYITLGALLTVWSGIWFMYLRNHPPGNQVVNYFCMGLMGTGIVLLLIGFTLGLRSPGTEARHAELPPGEVTGEAVQTERDRAAVGRM